MSNKGWVQFILPMLVGIRLMTVAALAWEESNPLALPEVGAHRLRILSPSVLELMLVTSKDKDPAPVREWNFVGENFRLTLPESKEFEVKADGQKIEIKAD